MIEVTGTHPKVMRIVTGYWSFDHAFANRRGEIGFPVRRMCEIFGAPGTGKSTLAITLCGILASQLGGCIHLADLEGYDPELAVHLLENVGYCGKLNYISGDSDSVILESLVDALREDGNNVGLIDSLGAISPIAEEKGQLGEANMGQRAKLLAQFSRKCNHAFNMKDDPSVVFATNHALPIIGMAIKGTTTPGGETKKFFAATRIKLFVKKIYPDGSNLVQGMVEKNSFGYSKRKFWLFNLAGEGFHPGLTAVMDCVQAGLATDKSVIKMNGKSYGRFTNMIEKYSDAELFADFQNLLKGVGAVLSDEPPSDDEEFEE